MGTMKNLYGNASEALGELPSWSKDWRWLTVCGLCIYAVVLAFRVSFAGQWDHPELWVNGERILATHDAYFWLAKANGFGQLKGYALAQLAYCVHAITGLGFGTIGFWGPAVISALGGVVCFLWGWILGGRNAGIFAGLLGSLTPGFYYRTRLGYFDTDMFTLIAPMLVALMLAYWASFHMKKGWFISESVGRSLSRAHSMWMALGFGVVTRLCGLWHQDIVNIAVLYFFMTLVVLFVNGKTGKRVEAIYGLIIFLLGAFPGTAYGSIGLWPIELLLPTGLPGADQRAILGGISILISVFIILFVTRSSKKITQQLDNPWVCAGIFLLFVALTGVAFKPVSSVFGKLAQYFFPAATNVGQGDLLNPIFPSVVQSIIEARLVAISEILSRGAFTSWLGWLALLASVVVMVLRPVAIFLLPLIVLQIASMKLGIRFTMFGGAALIVLLGVSLSWLVDFAARKLERRELVGAGVQILVSFCFLIYVFSQYSVLPVTPVIPKAHAESLVELGEVAAPDSMVWTWWDWGYATMYYAGLEPVSDGGKHAGRDIFPTAFVMSTDSPRKANRMIAFSSQYPDQHSAGTGLSPAAEWETIPRNQILTTLDDQLSRSDYPVEAPQYLVVSWKDLSISKWITYFGNWNLETGKTNQAELRMYKGGELGVNLQRGMVQNRMGQGGLVSDIDILGREKVTRKHYGMNSISLKLVPKTPYLVVNKITAQTILADKTAYESMMFRLMVDDPNNPEISKNFKLVVEKLPFVRIYEVVQTQ